MAVFWCAITDPALSHKATEAAAVLNDFLLTTDTDALMKNCSEGIIGIATGLLDYDIRGPGCGDLSTLAGWKLLLGATLAAFSHTGTLVQQIQGMIARWKQLKLTDFNSLQKFLSTFEQQYREISRICKQGQYTDRIPRGPECLDTIRGAVNTDLLRAAETRLIEVKEYKYDAIDYDTLKKALVKIQGERDDMATPPSSPAKLPTVTPPHHTSTPANDQEMLTQKLQQHGLCLYNVAGKCNKGGGCKYKHDSLESVGLDPTEFQNYQPATRFLKKKDETSEQLTGPASAQLDDAEVWAIKNYMNLKPGDPKKTAWLEGHGLQDTRAPAPVTTGPALAGPTLAWSCDWATQGMAEPSCEFK